MQDKRKFTPEFKAQVALEALCADERAVQALGHKYGLAESQIYAWRKELRWKAPFVFKNAQPLDESHRKYPDRDVM